MQTSQQAVDCLLRKRPAEFVPVADGAWGDTIGKWVQQGMPTDENGNAVDAIEHFGFDIAIFSTPFQWQAKLGPPEIVEETEELKIVRNGSGALLKWWKTRSGTPEHIDFHMSNRQVWDEEYRPHLVAEFRARIGDLQNLRTNRESRRTRGTWTCYSCQFIWENLRMSLGDLNMYMSLVSDPDWIQDFNRVYTDLYKECFRIILEEAGRPDGIRLCEDLGYRDRLFCSPDVLRELIFPYYAELVEFFHGYDLPVILHSCGYQEPMIPLAIEAGFDGINPMEVKAGNDIFKYAEQFGDDLCFFGGLDARILESGDRDLIRREVGKLITGMRERGARYIYGSDHSLSTLIDYHDFLYSLEVYREYRDC